MQPISIIIPTLNEADNLPLLFKRIDDSLTSSSIPYELVIVDDHSIDATGDIVVNADPKYNARLLMKQGKPGKAFSLLEGFAAAEYELVCMIDGDLQYPPEAIKAMYHKLQYCEADIVVTERIENKTSLLRRLSSFTFNFFFIRLLFGINYDTQSGLKLFRKNILKTISVDPSPWTFDLEFIVRALEQNYVIVSQQIPFSERNAGVPKVHLLRATIEIASNSLRLRSTTSTRIVKTNYRQLQRSFNLFVGLIGASLLLSLLPVSVSPRASALEFTPHGIYKALHAAIAPDQQKATEWSQVSSASATPPPAPASTTPTSASSTQPSTPQAAPTTTPLSQPTPPAATQSSVRATTIPPAQVSSPLPATPTATISGSQGINAPYYPGTKLSSAKTRTLLSLALKVVGVGVAFIILGLVTAGIRKLIARMHRQPLRV